MVALWAFRHWIQDLKERGKEAGKAWKGLAFESKTVADRLRVLRENPLETVSGRIDDGWQRRLRVAKARHRVETRSYFAHAHTESPESAADAPFAKDTTRL